MIYVWNTIIFLDFSDRSMVQRETLRFLQYKLSNSSNDYSSIFKNFGFLRIYLGGSLGALRSNRYRYLILIFQLNFFRHGIMSLDVKLKTALNFVKTALSCKNCASFSFKWRRIFWEIKLFVCLNRRDYYKILKLLCWWFGSIQPGNMNENKFDINMTPIPN